MKSINHQPNRRAIQVLSAGHLVSDAYGGFILPIMPLIALKLNISLGVVGLLLAISSLSSSLLQPVFGYISDIFRRRFFIIWGVIFSSVFISLIGVIDNIWILGLVLFLGNMGVGLFHPQATAFAGHLSGAQINRYMGGFTALGTIGYALGPFFSSLLVENFGLNSTIYAIFPGLAITYLMYVMLPKIPDSVDKPKLVFKSFKFNLSRIILILIFVAIIRALIVTSYDVFMPFIWERRDISVLWIGTLIALFSLLGGIASYIGGRVSNFIDKRTIMMFSLIPAIPCLLGSLYLVDRMPLFSFILFVLAGFITMSSSSVNLVIGQKAVKGNVGLISGLIGGFSWGVAGLLQSPIGFLATNYGIIPVLTVIALTPILGAISTAYISKEYA